MGSLRDAIVLVGCRLKPIHCCRLEWKEIHVTQVSD